MTPPSLPQAGLVGSVAFYLALAHNFHRSISDPFTRPSSRLASYHWMCWGAVLLLSIGYLFQADHLGMTGHGYRAAFLACWFPERRGSDVVNNWQVRGDRGARMGECEGVRVATKGSDGARIPGGVPGVLVSGAEKKRRCQ
jgi:hypothetical protein